MSLLQTLTTSIIRKNPNFPKLSSREQAQIVNQTYDKVIKSALNDVSLPPKITLFQQGVERRLYERHRPHYKKKHTMLDYEFIEKLRNKRDRVAHGTLTSASIPQKSIDTGSELSQSNSSSSNELENLFSNYSNISSTKYSEPSFFKSDLTEDIFKDKTTLKNYIFRLKLNLDKSLDEIYFVERENGSSVLEHSQKVKGIHVSKSLFQLYELFTLLDFVNLLERKFREEGKAHFLNQITNCYEVLFNYYKKWLKINGETINEITDLENTILSNDEFMNLNPNNPLFKGFSLLMENDIDMAKVKDLLNDKDIIEVFLKSFEKNN